MMTEATYMTGRVASVSEVRRGEITVKTETLDKLLHELHEEVIGLNVSEKAGAPDHPKPGCATSAGNILDEFAYRVAATISVVRDLRGRCEL